MKDTIHNETYFCLVNKTTKEKVKYLKIEEFFGEDEYRLKDHELYSDSPVWKCNTYEDALRVLYSPHCKWYASYYSSPAHELKAEDYYIVKYDVETVVKEEATKVGHNLKVAKELYSKIMYWKYGEDGVYCNPKLLAEKLRKNTGEIDKHELEEYMNFKED